MLTIQSKIHRSTESLSMRLSVKILFLFILLPLGSISQTFSEELTNRIDSYLEASEANGFSGVILVSRGDEILLSKGYGWADRNNKIPNTPASVFNIGSVTKQFTATAILKLVEQEKIRTSDKISSYFDQTPADKMDITIHQLLTHTSGISNKTGGFRYNEASKEQFLEEFFTSDLISKPGTTHHYANANYIMLAALIESISGQTYISFLNEHLFEPAQLNSTGYKKISFNPERLAHGYYYNRNEEEWTDWGTTQNHLPNNEKHWYSIGKGDLHSSAEDLYKWHVALTNDKILKPETRALQETPHVAENEERTSSYGYGWAIYNGAKANKIVSHNGSNGLYFTDFVRFIDEDIVIIYFTNAFLGPESENVAREIARMIYNPNYIAEPIPRNIYEVSHEFMSTNPSSRAESLPGFLKQQLNRDLKDHAVLNRLGFSRLKKEEEPGWALELFRLNVKLFPEDGNLWDSLGDAFMKYNMKKDASNSYRKALELGYENSGKKLNEILQHEQ